MKEKKKKCIFCKTITQSRVCSKCKKELRGLHEND